jgi:hypothetical protein
MEFWRGIHWEDIVDNIKLKVWEIGFEDKKFLESVQDHV